MGGGSTSLSWNLGPTQNILLGSRLLCSCVGGWAFLPGELKPDCGRIPAQLEVCANGECSQQQGRLGAVGWEEWGAGCVKWSLKSFHRSHRTRMARTISSPAGPALCLPCTNIPEASLPPRRALVVYFNSCLQLNIDHNASPRDVSRSETYLWKISRGSFAEKLIAQWLTGQEDRWVVGRPILGMRSSERGRDARKCIWTLDSHTVSCFNQKIK